MSGWVSALLRTVTPVFRIGPFKPSSTQAVVVKIGEGRTGESALSTSSVELYATSSSTPTVELKATDAASVLNVQGGGLTVTTPGVFEVGADNGINLYSAACAIAGDSVLMVTGDVVVVLDETGFVMNDVNGEILRVPSGTGSITSTRAFEIATEEQTGSRFEELDPPTHDGGRFFNAPVQVITQDDTDQYPGIGFHKRINFGAFFHYIGGNVYQSLSHIGDVVTFWTSGNDGPNSALDADTVDGVHGYDTLHHYNVNLTSIDLDDAAYYANIFSGYAYGNGALTNSPTDINYGTFMGFKGADFLTQLIFGDGASNHKMYTRTRWISGAWQPWSQIWTSTTDGSGSGLDADLLDGAQLSTDGTMAAGSNAKVPSEAAVKTYVFTKALQPIGANWDNGLDAIVVADTKVVFVPCLISGTIVDISIMTDNLVDGSCVVDIWKANDAYPTVSDTIISGTKPTITSAREQTSYSLANLSTTDVAVGDRFGFKLDSAADLSSITVIVTVGPN